MHSFGLGCSNCGHTKLPTIEAKNLQSRQFRKLLIQLPTIGCKFKIVGKAMVDIYQWRSGG